VSLSIRLSSTMTEADIAPHRTAIMACLRRFVDRYADQITLESIWGDILRGNVQLWLITDDADGAVVMVQLTEIINNLATGRRVVRLLNTGGARFFEALPLIDEIEAWARDVVKATEIEAVGRKAFVRVLEPRGYRFASVTVSKRLAGD
jgi:hypothetical protein